VGVAQAAGVSGRVVHADDPVARATVYAYRVVERTFEKVATDESGRFLFSELPAGLYKIVAHKIGLPPAVLVLARRSAAEAQFVQVELSAVVHEPEDDFWSTRASVPGDVLRDLEFGAPLVASAVTRDSSPIRFTGEVQAIASHGDLDESTASAAATEVALRGVLGGLRLELQGEIGKLGGASARGAIHDPIGGQTSSFRLGLAGEHVGEFGVEGETRKWFGAAESASPVALDRLQLRYAGELAEGVSTRLVANYLDESGLFRRGKFVPAVFPNASRWLTVEGGYALSLGDLGTLQGGLRYRESALERLTLYDDPGPYKYLDLWSKGATEVDSTFLVEYGFFSTFRDGKVSVSPRGGLIVRFRPDWQASVGASRRYVISDEHPLLGDFALETVAGTLSCANSEAACYEAEVAHGEGGNTALRVRGSWREFDRTVRLLLREDLLFGGDGLYVVPGDELPEVSATVERRLGSAVVASWQTSYAEGGGGTFLAANRRTYRNDVTYLGSAIDTRIEPTATGIFLAFHRLEQRLEALSGRPVRGRRPSSPDTQLELVELVVSQDLSEVFDLARAWAVKVGMELVRGASFVNPIDQGADTRRRITTGVAVRF
jgi:hypothetical protein